MTSATLGLDGLPALGTILSIWAHPDDETFLAGGIMAAAGATGQRVVCVSATAGEKGTDDPETWPAQRLGQVRRWEASAAMSILGVADHRFLGLPDGELAALDPADPVAELAAIIAEVAPDSILTFGPDGVTFHPDHQTISHWVDDAWALAGSPGRLLHAAASEDHLATWGAEYERWGVYMTDERPVGIPAHRLAVSVTFTGTLLDQKIAALSAMYTQTASSIVLLGEKGFRSLNEEESFVEAPR